MSFTIQPVPCFVYVLPNGTEASIFSAAVAGAKKVRKGWTWGVTKPNGSYTQGLGRPPAKTMEDAVAQAKKFAEATGATYVPPEVDE